jgi:hypothetical protein
MAVVRWPGKAAEAFAFALNFLLLFLSREKVNSLISRQKVNSLS